MLLKIDIKFGRLFPDEALEMQVKQRQQNCQDFPLFTLE